MFNKNKLNFQLYDYTCESRVLSEKQKSKIQAIKMKCLRTVTHKLQGEI